MNAANKQWASLVLGLSLVLPAAGDDTELYVAGGDVITSSRPQVMIIFDNSGSMRTEEAVAPAPFDPTVDYTNGNNRNRIYYVKGAVDPSNYPDPRDGSERRYVNWNQNACADSLRPHPSNASINLLTYGGLYTNNIRAFRYNKNRNNGIFWRQLPDSIADDKRQLFIIDCKADLDSANANNASSHPNSGLRGSGFVQDVNKTSPFDGTATTASALERETNAASAQAGTRFGSGDTVTLFTENYLTYFHTATTSDKTRLQIAKDTITGLVNSTAGVDFGLTVFNYENAGRVVKGIKEMTDTNRTSLVNTVNALSASTWTPLCETLFEAYRYYAGKAVHKGTLEPSRTPVFDASVINNGFYTSPMLACQPQAYVVLITDGAPTRDNSYDSLIKSELGLTDADKVDGNLLPGVADKLYNSDLSASLQGQQRVVTYTIGFSDGADNAANVLEEAALRGGGEYYPAADAQALQGALQQIFSQILAVNASFTSPSIAANSFDRTRTLDAVYYAMFLPSDRPRWLGNLKKLKINSASQVVDSSDSKAIDIEGNISDNACTIWTSSGICALASSGGDGNDVGSGGVLEALQKQTNRTFFTSPAGSSGALVSLNKANLAAAVGGESEMLSDLGISDSNLATAYVSWLKGVDVDDEDEDLSATDLRFDVMGDPLHSKPVAINYGSGDGVRIVVGTNAGVLHMFEDKGNSVSESWSWYVADLLDTLPQLRANEKTGGHTVYGVDGPPVVYIQDSNGNGVVDAGSDKVWLYFGLRRGGRIYYGLDITDPDSPSLMWKVSSASPNMAELGQTWAEPLVTTVPANGGKPVVIVGGGYDANKDSLTVGAADNMGRGVFILDAESGSLVHRFTALATKSSSSTPLPTTDSIPNKVAALDSDGDGISDRLYATDTGANVWRIDMPSSERDSWSVIKFADLGGTTLANDRRFHAEVSVAQTSFDLRQELVIENPDGSDSTIVTNSEVPFDAVVVGSGNRAHPNSTGTNDHLYMLQDRWVLSQTFGTDDNPAPAVITQASLYNVANDPFGNADNEAEQLAAELALGATLGWYYPLAPKEKALAAPTVIAGSAFFTTFTPGDTGASINACVSAGAGHLYEFSLQQGIGIRSVSLGARLPDTPQIVVPPPPSPTPDDWDPTLYLIGVGAGDNRSGTIATNQLMTPNRVYYHSGNN
ncbi:PilC/PilY family type IV pilus protein [uncultured Ferrimonas sp.]|uniref:pilus assembly protein n=1 Tax=uncultured Ferrimonas sp. TaxID=432640 RepID=UPI002627E85F|nr:PilC/PilY family type IV pilus protein [uncultured Ferrimonas sp.]